MIDWDGIKDDYIKRNGDVKLKDFAEEYGVKYATLRSRKNRENWDEGLVATKNAAQQPKPKNVATKNVKAATKAIKKLEEAELTEKQRLFCLHYVKSFNATMSALKAGYSKVSAHVEGCRLLKNDKIAAEIRRLKGNMAEGLFIDGMDVLRKYAEIAFADITDYVEFGNREVPIILPMAGPLTVENDAGEKEQVTTVQSFVDLKPSDTVDGSIISEVSQGRDGVKIKLADKMKALEKLEKYFDVIPDKWKRKIEEEKLKLAARKAGEEEDSADQDDGFLEALSGQVDEVWADEED